MRAGFFGQKKAVGQRLRAAYSPPVVHVELTTHLLDLLPSLREAVGDCATASRPGLDVTASTVAEVVREIDQLAPGFSFYVCDERGSLRPHVNIFIESERVADRRSLSDRVTPGQRVTIMQALSGG